MAATFLTIATAAATIAAASVSSTGGGKAIGDDIRAGYFITTVLEVRTRDKDRKIVYLQKTDDCFSKPWMGK